MPKTRGPLLGLRASGKLGGHRRGPYASRTLVSHVTADTKISGLPDFTRDFNYGDAPSYRAVVLFIGDTKSSWERALLRFDLSSLIGRSFSSAALRHDLIAFDGSNTSLRLSRLVSPANWTENGVTWNNRNPGNPWANPGSDFDDTGPPASVDFDCPSELGFHQHAFMLPFVEDALANRSGILSFHIRLVDEDPPGDFGREWNAKEPGTPASTILLTP